MQSVLIKFPTTLVHLFIPIPFYVFVFPENWPITLSGSHRSYNVCLVSPDMFVQDESSNHRLHCLSDFFFFFLQLDPGNICDPFKTQFCTASCFLLFSSQSYLCALRYGFALCHKLNSQKRILAIFHRNAHTHSRTQYSNSVFLSLSVPFVFFRVFYLLLEWTMQRRHYFCFGSSGFLSHCCYLFLLQTEGPYSFCLQ